MTFLHLLAAYGVCFGLMNDKAKPLTDGLCLLPWGIGDWFTRLFACAYCTGFHCGWVVWVLSALFEERYPWEIPLWCFASCAFCFVVEAWVEWLEAPQEELDDGQTAPQPD